LFDKWWSEAPWWMAGKGGGGLGKKEVKERNGR